MKTIKVSEKDYEVLMELSKELQTQTNNYQAFPYFWEPSSMKTEVNIHGEGKEVEVYYDCETYTLEEFAESDELEEYKKFIDWEDIEVQDKENITYDKDLESEWQSYIDSEIDDADVWTLDWKQQQDHNPSLFLSDVKGYIKNNAHHLGRDPHTYSRTISRMPKMEKLVECLLRFNKEVPEEEINNEALRFRNKK